MASLRVVVDTNVLISRLLLPSSVPARAVNKAIEGNRLLVSEPTMQELAEVAMRPKFDRYASIEDRQQFVRDLAGIVELVPILRQFHVCRDPKDDKFLDVAVNGEADVLVSGDPDLLVLDPFLGVRIVAPADWLAGLDAPES